MFKFIAALLGTIALMLVGVAPANAATVITLDADGTSLPVAASATDWSKNTDVTVVAGDCTGTRCVHFKIVDFACNRGAPVGGCAYRIPDGSCQVEVSKWVVDRGMNLPLLVTKHEAGHCIWSYSGISQAYHLPDQPHALMSATHSISPTLKEATLTSIDRRYTRTLF